MLRSKASVITSLHDLSQVVLLGQWEKGIPLGEGLVYIPSHCISYFQHLHWTNVFSTSNQKQRFRGWEVPLSSHVPLESGPCPLKEKHGCERWLSGDVQRGKTVWLYALNALLRHFWVKILQ